MSAERQPMSELVPVSVAVRVHAADTLFLRNSVGNAKDANGAEFELSTAFHDNSPIVRLPDGRWVTFPWESLVHATQSAGEVYRG